MTASNTNRRETADFINDLAVGLKRKNRTTGHNFVIIIVCPMHCIAAFDRIYNHAAYPVSGVRSECEKLRIAITQQRVLRSTSCLVL